MNDVIHSASRPWVETLASTRVRLRVVTPPTVDHVWCQFGDRYSETTEETPLDLIGGITRRVWHGVLDVPTRRLKYRFRTATRGRTTPWVGPGGIPTMWFEFPYVYPDPPGIDRVAGRTVYSIFPDRFARHGNGPAIGEPFYGGDLRGILDHTNYLRDLGVSLIYLNPIWPSPSYHRYDATHYYDVDPRLGTLTDWLDLVGT
ncbi:MAG: alpha-amylase family glycosyl hydrolase, partial [Sulfobacillus sp.]|nr:alpha-amylase family glycosyl hydrolase [Sulfobacillus sp.]